MSDFTSTTYQIKRTKDFGVPSRNETKNALAPKKDIINYMEAKN